MSLRLAAAELQDANDLQYLIETRANSNPTTIAKSLPFIMICYVFAWNTSFCIQMVLLTLEFAIFSTNMFGNK